jgi:hypothetical protein
LFLFPSELFSAILVNGAAVCLSLCLLHIAQAMSRSQHTYSRAIRQKRAHTGQRTHTHTHTPTVRAVQVTACHWYRLFKLPCRVSKIAQCNFVFFNGTCRRRHSTAEVLHCVLDLTC